MYNNKIQYGLIHCHTEASKKDSSQTIKDLVITAKELGCPAITLTNHGVMIDVYAFMKECDKHGIKGIPGVEAYYNETENIFDGYLSYDMSVAKRSHLLLLAKDEIGFKTISKIVSDSYNYMDKGRVDSYPCVNFSLLKKHLGKGTEGYGHVFVCSACMAGVLASVLLSNNALKKQIKKAKKKRTKYNDPNAESYLKNKEKLAELKDAYTIMMEEKKELEKIANKKTTAKEKTLNSLKDKDPDKYEIKKQELEELKMSISKAKENLQKIKNDIANNKRRTSLLNQQLKEEEKTHERFIAVSEEIKYLEQHLYDDDILYEDTKKFASYFERLVGKGNFYIELQYHGIEEEAYVMPLLANIAKELHIPTVATNDVHIARKTEDDIKARQIQRSLRFNKWENAHESDKELYIKTDNELVAMLSEIFSDDIINQAMLGIKTIVDNCNGKISSENHYPKYKSLINGETSDDALRRICNENILWRYPNYNGWDDEHKKRLNYELSVMQSMGYSDYHLIVQDYLDYGRLLGKLPDNEIESASFDKEELKQYLIKNNYDVGLGIGPGRGSGVGSLVCYLLGITAIDPLEYNLLFERFLNVERVSMPDIDSDFKTNIRDKCVEYVKHVYGEQTVCRIMTKGTQAAKAAIRNCARLLGSELHDDTRAYLDLGDQIAKLIPNEPGIKLEDCLSILTEKFATNKTAMTIIDNAKLVEGAVTQYGIHAGGVIIADGGAVGEYVPLMYDEKKHVWKTQCDMVECEENGLIKMDFLGLNNLDIITETVRSIKNRYGISINPETVPIEKEVLKHVFATGITNAVFQFESVGMKNMLKQFKPDCFEDLILLVAAYRPGPMQYLADIIEIKNGHKELVYLTPMLEPILKNTYGSIIFQEQVMEIFQKLSGYSLGQADLVRRAMSKKKTEVLEKERQSFIYGDKTRNIMGCISNNISPEIANELFDQMVEFAKYAFNKSHATAYAFVSYITAYFKFHYPAEYLCSVMKFIKKDKIREKIPGLLTDLNHYNIELLAPNINISDNDFSIIGDNIVFGLGSIKGVGSGSTLIIEERQKNGPYKSYNDFMKRVGINTKKNVIVNLIQAGALDIFCGNRMAMISKVESTQKLLKKITENEQKLLEKLEISQKDKRTINTIERINESIEECKNLLTLEKFNLLLDDSDRLIQEKELTGLFLTASPLDDYSSPQNLGCIPLSDIYTTDNASVMGIISNYNMIYTKKTGQPMAFFDLEDGNGMIEVVCFPKDFAKFQGLLAENKVVKINGKIEEVENFNDNENDETFSDISYKLYVSEVEDVPKILPDVLISIDSLLDWNTFIYPYIKENNYISNTGYNLLVLDKSLNEIRKCNFRVSQSILKDKKILPILKKK